jgi:hypothetical protein
MGGTPRRAVTTIGKHSPNSHPDLSQHELRRVAVAGQCDPRSIVTYLRGGRMVSTTIARVEAALSSCGYKRLVRASTRDPEPSP